MLQNKPTFRWIHKLMDHYNSPIICIRLGKSTHVIVVSSPVIACEFLKLQDEIFASRPESISGYLISDGYRSTIMAPLGDQWRKMRRILNQSILSLPTHKWLQPKRDKEANRLLSYVISQLENQHSVTQGGLINIRTVSQQFCGNMIRNIVFGTRLFGKGLVDGGPGDEEIEHISALFVILKYVNAFCVSDYFPWLRRKIDFDGHEKIIRTAIERVRKLGLGRNPDVWEEPMRFDPDRHLGEEGKQVVLTDNELRMLSFSTGKRGCPGVILGSTITTMLLARMIQGFAWEVI
ncbi:hypothetical protein QVD17_27450 [Tagetes erecta]|uniref:Cytochrome P450 n=1 Tax=Tagetes erecta TaxID=13708 RepID=A0AAD8NRE0_TARER|nr:hypothetical protein QVD17_27450 [Tagetes erecta]